MSRSFTVLALAAVMPAAALAQGGMQWLYTPVIDENPLQTRLTLAYGVPQTDDVQAMISCMIGANWIYADLQLAAPIDGLETGSPARLTLQGQGSAVTLDATVLWPETEVGIWGLRAAVALDDPLWTLLFAPQPVRYRVGEGPAAMLGTVGARGPTLAFLNDCLNIDLLHPPREKG